jgi:hypothetical protein
LIFGLMYSCLEQNFAAIGQTVQECDATGAS